MTTRYPLRGIGPSTFLSYSYADQALATELAAGLEALGLRVHKEDETTLLGKPLPEMLGKRVAEREVFVQLLTKTANASAWVRKEFDWATARQGTGRIFSLIPLVVDVPTVSDAIAAHDHEDASMGITNDLLDRVVRRSLETVQLLPMSDDSPFEFDRRSTEQFLIDAVPGGRRVIVDSDGHIPTVHDALLGYVSTIEQPDKESVAHYMAEMCERMRRRLDLVDLVAPWLFAHLYSQLKWKGVDFPGCAVGTVQRFCRLTIGRDLLELYRLVPLDRSEYMSRFADVFRRAEECIGRASQVDPSVVDLGKDLWCAAGEQDRYDAFVQVRFLSYNPEHTPRVVLPKSALGGEEWKERIRSGERAASLVSPEDWALFGLPQVAALAVGILDRGALSKPDELQNLGWDLTRYRRLGL